MWLGNVRGSTYSRSHVSLDADSNEFWDFSFDEMAAGDIPAMVQYVLYQAGSSQLSYVGHSQGTTVLVGALAANPSLNDSIRSAALLAPAVFATNIDSFPLKTLAQYNAAELFEFFGVKEFLPSTASELFASFCAE